MSCKRGKTEKGKGDRKRRKEKKHRRKEAEERTQNQNKGGGGGRILRWHKEEKPAPGHKTQKDAMEEEAECRSKTRLVRMGQSMKFVRKKGGRTNNKAGRGVYERKYEVEEEEESGLEAADDDRAGWKM